MHFCLQPVICFICRLCQLSACWFWLLPVFVKAPMPIWNESKAILNTLEELAYKNHIPYIDYTMLYDEIQLDFDAYLLDGKHLNQNGGVKVSRHFKHILKEYLPVFLHPRAIPADFHLTRIKHHNPVPASLSALQVSCLTSKKYSHDPTEIFAFFH